MKNLWIIANWKSNKNIREALEWVSAVGLKLERRENLKVVICPTFDVIPEVKKAVLVGNYPLMVGSQDLSPFDIGAYTGEEPASILAQYVDLAILGHSERRQNFKETDKIIANKFKQALEHNIIPLVCVQGPNTPVPEGCRLVAYEPIFAIGTGNPDTPENASAVAQSLKQQYGDNTEILYGGSVNASNCSAFLKEKNINGLLIGTASLNQEEFIKIVSTAYGF